MSSNPSITSLLDLSGQVALITGASRGIGRATAELFVQAGARVALLARSAAPLEEAAEALRQAYGPERVLAIPTDVARAEQVDAAVQQVAGTWGQIDTLINNAGLIHFEPSKTAKTSGKDVDIPITPEVAAVLARARKLAKIDPTLGGNAYIIQTSSGTPYTASGIRGAIGFAAERAGLAPPRHAGQRKPRASGFTAKDLRAYASSSANQQGYSFEKLKTALAHARIATTEGYVQQHTTPVSEVVMRLPNRPL